MTQNSNQIQASLEDLSTLEPHEVILVLREIQSRQLLMALAISGSAIKEAVYKALPSKAAAMLKSDLEELGPVEQAEVQAAQEAMLSVALRLQSEGKLSISKP